MTVGSSTVGLKIFLGVGFDIKRELLNFLAIYKMEMNRVHVRGQVDYVKIVGFSDLKGAV
jgi:hypothetical protein